MRALLIGPLLSFANRLRFKHLFLATCGLFVLTLILPDPIPFADEILFGLATLLLSQWKKRGLPTEPQTDTLTSTQPPIDLPADQVRREG